MEITQENLCINEKDFNHNKGEWREDTKISDVNHSSTRMSTKIHILKEGKDHHGLTRGVFQKMKDIAQQYGCTHLVRMLSAFNACDTLIERVELGCVKFVLNVKSREGLEKLWDMYSSGELARKLTEILVTDELMPGDKTGIAIQTTIHESDMEQGRRFFDELQKPQQEAQSGEQSQGEIATSSGQQRLEPVDDPDSSQTNEQSSVSSQETIEDAAAK